METHALSTYPGRGGRPRTPVSRSPGDQTPWSRNPATETPTRRRAAQGHGCRPTQAGFTLIEVLVSAVVISVALLGLAALQTSSVRFNQSSLIRTQAVSLSYDLADRMRANSANAADYDSGTSPPSGSLAEDDISDWNARLAELMPSGTPTSLITVDTTNNEVTIQIQWTERDSSTPAFEMTTRL